MSKLCLLTFFLLALVFQSMDARFSDALYNWLVATYGQASADTMARPELGADGSFGGGTHVPQVTTARRPVLIVVGTTSIAGDYSQVRDYLLSHGYLDEEVYATTYWDGTSADQEKLKCFYFMEIRQFIITLANFTNSKVDVLAYSMGDLIARKAILGGNCVEDGTPLGPGLSNHVHHYVSVAGPNYGVSLCSGILSGQPTCNTVNGMRCNSSFYQNVNNGLHYEGDTIDTIYSTNDNKIGYQLPNSCGKINGSRIITGKIANQNNFWPYSNLNHDQTIFNTLDKQLAIVSAP